MTVGATLGACCHKGDCPSVYPAPVWGNSLGFRIEMHFHLELSSALDHQLVLQGGS